MEFKFQHILAFLALVIVASLADLSPEDYWNSVLPNSSMPKAVKKLLHPPVALLEDKNTRVGAKTPITGSAFIYNYAAVETLLHECPIEALYFLEKDLHEGKNMNLHFSKATNDVTLLSRQVADSIPFSSNKLPEILNKFSVNPNSAEAEIMKKTIKECEDKGIKVEEKYCTTSLESMIDFTTSKLGKNVEAISTDAENGTLKMYNIVGVKKMPSEKAVLGCHRQPYAYVVFYCHRTETTIAYEVALMAGDGSKAETVAVCHRDTSAWNPKHLAFQVLKVKPGNVPVCHFLPEDHIVWVPKY